MRNNTGRMEIVPKLKYRFNVMPIRMPFDFFVDINQLIKKFMLNYRDPKLPKQS